MIGKILQKFSIAAGSLCIIGAMILVIAYGLSVGTIIAFGIGVVLLAAGLWLHKLPKWTRRTFFAVAGIGALYFIIITTIVVVSGNREDATFDEDCALVLGSGIRGETVLPTLQARLDKCLEYLQKNPNTPVVVSGGEGHNESISEAEAMKRYLTQHGIPEHLIIMENHSHNTRENFSNTQKILDGYFGDNHYTIACITTDYHLFRSRRIARQTGMDAHFYSAGVKWYLRPSAYCREALSIIKFWLIS